MAEQDIARLVVSMEANLKKYERALSKATGDADKSARRIENRFKQMQQNVESSFDLGGLQTALGGIGLGLLGTEVVQYADAWTNAGNRLAAAGVPLEEVGGKLSQLNAIANEARAPLEGVVTLYARLAASADTLGISQGELLRVTETVAKSLSASGASAAEVNSVVTQLGQALASGTLQGDELRSLSEASPQLMQQLAKALGVPIGQLKRLGSEGKLTSKVVVNALLGASDAIDKSFDATQSSIGAALVVLNNSLTEFIGTAAQSSGAAAALAGAIELLAKNLPAAAGALGAFVAAWLAVSGGTAAVTAVRALVPATVALAAAAKGASLSMLGLAPATAAAGTAATGAAVAFRGLFAALAASPLGIAIVAAAAVGTAIYAMSGDVRDGEAALERYNEASARASKSSARFAELTRIASERDIKSATAIVGDHKEAIWDLIEAQRAAAREQMNQDAAAELRAKAQLGILGELAKAKERAASVGDQTENQIAVANFDSFQEVDAALAGANAETANLAEGLSKLGIPPALASDLDGIKSRIIAAAQAGDFERAVSLTAEASAAISADDVLTPETKQQLQADFAGLLEILRVRAADAGIKLSIDADASQAESVIGPLIEKLESDATSLQDILDGVSQTELDNAPADFLEQLNAAIGDAQGEWASLRNELNEKLIAAGVSQEVVGMIDALVGQFQRGEISAVQFNEQLKNFGVDFNISPILEGVQDIINRMGFLGRIMSAFTGGKTAVETNTPTPTPSSGGGSRATPYDDRVKSMKRETAQTLALAAAQARLNPLAADYELQMEALRQEQELLNAAQEQGLAITPAIAAAIKQMAMENASATIAMQALNDAQENLAKRAEEWRTTLKDASSSFVKDLIAGKSAADALAGALQRVADKLVDIALEQAFSAIFPKGGGRGGNFLTRLLGFSEGGYTGDGGKNEPAGVVHKGEYVFSKDATKRIGVNNLQKLHRGYSSGGLVGGPAPAVTESASKAAKPSDTKGNFITRILGFSDGGYTGSGGKYEPAGVVHKGEYVFSKDATKRIGLENLEKLHRGYANGGLVGGPTPVIPRSVTKASGPNGNSTTVNVINNAGAPVQQTKRSEGGRDIIDIVVGEVQSRMAQGKFDRTMGGRFGVTPRLTGR